MSIFSTLTGSDGVAAAANAVYMEHLLSVLPQARLEELTRALETHLARTASYGTHSDAVARFNRASRAVQLNLLVHAATEIGQRPAIAGVRGWFDVRNPFTALPTAEVAAERVRDAERLVSRQYGVEVHVPPEAFALPTPEVDGVDIGPNFEALHQANDQAYLDGDIEPHEHLQAFRRILLHEVRALVGPRD